MRYNIFIEYSNKREIIMLKGNEIRQLYLDFFEKKYQHTIVESSSLVPDNPTVLHTTAGMLQFLPIF